MECIEQPFGASAYVACRCGQMIGLHEVACPHCGEPHPRVIEPRDDDEAVA